MCEAGSGIQSLFAKPLGKQTKCQKRAVRQTDRQRVPSIVLLTFKHFFHNLNNIASERKKVIYFLVCNGYRKSFG